MSGTNEPASKNDISESLGSMARPCFFLLKKKLEKCDKSHISTQKPIVYLR